MTEEEWLTGTDPTPMLEFLRGKASDRKLRLFACTCYLAIRPETGGAAFDRAAKVGERWADADGQLEADEVEEAMEAVWLAHSQAVDAGDHGTAIQLIYPLACLMPHEPESMFLRRTPSLRERLRSLPDRAIGWLLGRSWTSEIRLKKPGASSLVTSSATRSGRRRLIPAGGHPPSPPSPRPSTRTVPMTGCRSWRTPWKKPAATTPTCWLTSAARGRTSGDVGRSI